MMKPVTEHEFDSCYGKGMYEFARELINRLAPVTRRDDWWSTDGPYEIIAQMMRDSHAVAYEGHSE